MYIMWTFPFAKRPDAGERGWKRFKKWKRKKLAQNGDVSFVKDMLPIYYFVWRM